MDKKVKYGVNTLIKDVHVNSVDFAENFKNPEYKYIVEIKNIYDRNSNGYDHMKIYTDGNLEVFNIGNWKISPIVVLPYNWTGYSAEIEMSDKNSDVYKKLARPDDTTLPKKQNLIPEIKWVFETIRSMESIEDCEHFELIDYLAETNRLLRIYKSSNVSSSTFLELFQRLEIQKKNFENLKDKLQTENACKLKIQLNESIDIFNNLKLRYIDNN